MTDAAIRRWWLLVTNDDQRQYHGHEGYADDPSREYAYDGFVNNAKRLGKGDIVLIVGDRHVLGLGVVEEIRQWPCEKTIRYCPECGNTNLKRRKTMTPIYRCDRGHTFDAPDERARPTICYLARYWDSFIAFRRLIDRETIRACEAAPTSQGGMRPLDPEKTREVLAGFGIEVPA